MQNERGGGGARVLLWGEEGQTGAEEKPPLLNSLLLEGLESPHCFIDVAHSVLPLPLLEGFYLHCAERERWGGCEWEPQ